MKYTDGIVITRGDDSDAFNNKIAITITTDLDLTGYTAVFQIAKEQWIFTDITSKVLNIIIDKDRSMKFKEGTHYAALKIYEPSGTCKTMFRDIPVYVREIAVDNINLGVEEQNDGE